MSTDEQRRLTRIRSNLERRALIFQYTREFFREKGFLEVETPVRMPALAPEAQISPFRSEGWFLSTSPELHMKRLLAAGYDKLFQISRCFRKGERGRWHNPEFSLLEWYHAGADYLDMIRDTEELLLTLNKRLKLGGVISYQHQNICLTPPWTRITVREAFIAAAGWDPVARCDSLRFDTDLLTRVMPSFPADRPTVLLDYPASLASLARLKKGAPQVAERAEVFIGGLELANTFTELNDRHEQEKRFRQERRLIQQQYHRRMPLPQRFIEAMTDLPECGGIALGMDRLVMLFCNADSIDEVMAFPSDTV
ncbi:MAG: EF-P lysine aminoacylase GenX [Chloroflexi bacterium]|nr:EF-P lysine aminoacylase GenX [Chloroflexota bacterium]